MRKSVLACSILLCLLGLFGTECLALKSFTNSIGMTLIQLPAGDFIMGSPPSEKGREVGEKPHRVFLSRSFYISATEVTQGQWQRIMGTNPSGFKNCGQECPVEQVSWQECREFIRRLNQHEKTESYRLPTEAEWEYACRAGSPTAFSQGDIVELFCEKDPVLDPLGWYCANSGFRPQPAARKQPNAWGLYDMHGNVWEWCQDSCQWRDRITGRVGVTTSTYREGITDPLSQTGSRRIIRGGGWNQSARNCRSANRSYFRPTARRSYIGFRVVKIP